MLLQDAYAENFIMDAIGARKVIYNISWEDPAIDMDVSLTPRQPHSRDSSHIVTHRTANATVPLL